MATEKPKRLVHPRHWPSWLAAASVWLLARLPFRAGLAVTGALAPLMYRLMKSRRHIAETNVQACFPEYSDRRQTEVVRDCFDSLARALGEMAYAWGGSWQTVVRQGDVDGLDILKRAEAGGRGVLIVTCHMTCLEIGGAIMAGSIDHRRLAGIYRPLKNPVMEWFQNRGRTRYTGTMIKKRDTRAAIRHLRNGGYLWYAPDQDFGTDQSLFVPFFGIQTATLTATHRLATLGRAAVVLMFPRRLDSGRYRIEFVDLPESLPTDDIARDLALINAHTERVIRMAPNQYWWIHRRFKTRPDGEPPFYQPRLPAG